MSKEIINKEIQQQFCQCLLPNNIIMVIQSWSKLKRYRFMLQNIAKIIGYAYTADFFTNENIMSILSCKTHTARKYTAYLKKLDLINESRDQNNLRKYSLKKYIYIQSLYMFLLTNLVCPRMLDKQSPVKKEFKKLHQEIKKYIEKTYGKNVKKLC